MGEPLPRLPLEPRRLHFHPRPFPDLAALREEGIEAAEVGEVTEPDAGTVLVVDGAERPLEHPGLDPFWEAFGRWAREAAS
jgi:hypothetical protein